VTETGQGQGRSGGKMTAAIGVLAMLVAIAGAVVYSMESPAKPDASEYNVEHDANAPATHTKAETAAPILRVTYFHRTIRCPSCEKIEALAQKAVEEGFAGELADGRMQWRIINIDEPRNKHFEDDYQLQMQSVIVSEVRGGKETRWKNLEKVWDLLDDEAGFLRYVQDEIRAYGQGT
jgi:hypothetical protein